MRLDVNITLKDSFIQNSHMESKRTKTKYMMNLCRVCVEIIFLSRRRRMRFRVTCDLFCSVFRQEAPFGGQDHRLNEVGHLPQDTRNKDEAPRRTYRSLDHREFCNDCLFFQIALTIAFRAAPSGSEAGDIDFCQAAARPASLRQASREFPTTP